MESNNLTHAKDVSLGDKHEKQKYNSLSNEKHPVLKRIAIKTDKSLHQPQQQVYDQQHKLHQQQHQQPPQAQQFTTYSRRWYILVLYSMYGMTELIIWMQWGPIATTAEDAFHWSDGTIALIGNWGAIANIIVGLVYPWFIQVKGFRLATVSSMMFVTLASTLRVITSDPSTATPLIHISAFLNAVGGQVAMSGATTLSSNWFSANDRVVATTVSIITISIGEVVGCVLGPAIVQSTASSTNASISTTTLRPGVSTRIPTRLFSNRKINHLSFVKESILNATGGEMFSEPNLYSYHEHAFVYDQSNNSTVQATEREQIMQYMYYTCGWAWLLLLLLIAYFPSKPPTPPSASSLQRREDYWKGLWSLRNNVNFLLIAAVYAIALGVQAGWSFVLTVNLKKINISETSAGWIGFYAAIASICSTLIIGKFSSYFFRRVKIFIFVMYALSCCFYAVLAFMMDGIIVFGSYTEAAVYVCVIAGGALINGVGPLTLELSCELAYPIGEGAANAVLNFLMSIGVLIFLGLFSVPNIGSMWMNWALVAAVGVCLPLIAVLKCNFRRLEVDEDMAGTEARGGDTREEKLVQ